MTSDSPMQAANENSPRDARSFPAESSSAALDSGENVDRGLYLIDLCHRAAIFHNLIGAVYYYKSQYGLGIQHFRRGVERLIEEERLQQQMLRVPVTTSGTFHDELSSKCTEMKRELQNMQTQHCAMLNMITKNSFQLPRSSMSRSKTSVAPRREPILIDRAGNFHFLRSDGISSPVLPSSLPTCYDKTTKSPSQQWSPNVVSSVIMYNLSICQSSIGNYDTALELIHLSRETAHMACATSMDIPPATECTCTHCRTATDANSSRLATPFYPPNTNGSGPSIVPSWVEIFQQCLDQVERRLLAESSAVRTSYTDKRNEAAPAA